MKSTTSRNERTAAEVIGLVPAAGRAERLAPLPLSKEVYPIGFHRVAGAAGESWRPKAVGHYLLERMRRAGIQKAYVVIRKGKWDIPAYFEDGALLSMHLAYLMVRSTSGQPHTLDEAYPFVRHARIALGFPDILFEPADAFARLLDRQDRTKADVVLGLFPARRKRDADMVERDLRGRITAVVVKPRRTQLRYTWLLAVWGSSFTEFMHHHLTALAGDGSPKERPSRELFVGDVVQAAIRAGSHVDSVTFQGGKYMDIGTPEDLRRAVGRVARGAGLGPS